ncbi:hypothetical protein RJ639_031354 [Escallonia herrerae]|uniref:Pentatricopeptide repeat-containing protein n=1 Tax=Escallonia herrerae TaxID=1293975 RepID=A0AA88WX69_9ASTE|nr:hypothetical protein RJ639_031354 [Escallonia herrerae]
MKCARGIAADDLTMTSLVYGLSSRGRVREAYMVMEGIEKHDISVYHGLIKGLLRLRRAGEATNVFREMIRRGCEPTMHTYVERVIDRRLEVPRFDYNRFLHYFSNEEGVLMFENMSKKLREVGLFDLADTKDMGRKWLLEKRGETWQFSKREGFPVSPTVGLLRELCFILWTLLWNKRTTCSPLRTGETSDEVEETNGTSGTRKFALIFILNVR